MPKIWPWIHTLTTMPSFPGCRQSPLVLYDRQASTIWHRIWRSIPRTRSSPVSHDVSTSIILILSGPRSLTSPRLPAYTMSQSIPQEADVPPFRPTFAPLYSDSEPLILDGDIAVPDAINRLLKAYQPSGVQFLYDLYRRSTGGILGDDMGCASFNDPADLA